MRSPVRSCRGLAVAGSLLATAVGVTACTPGGQHAATTSPVRHTSTNSSTTSAPVTPSHHSSPAAATRNQALQRLGTAEDPLPTAAPLYVGTGRGGVTRRVRATRDGLEVRLVCTGPGSASIFGDASGKPLMSLKACDGGAIYGARIPRKDVTLGTVTLQADSATTWTMGIWPGQG